MGHKVSLQNGREWQTLANISVIWPVSWAGDRCRPIVSLLSTAFLRQAGRWLAKTCQYGMLWRGFGSFTATGHIFHPWQ